MPAPTVQASTDFERDRDREYPLYRSHTYLDWAGAALPPASMVENCFSGENGIRSRPELLMNPHTVVEAMNGPRGAGQAGTRSEDSVDTVERVRAQVLSFLGGEAGEWTLVFTKNMGKGGKEKPWEETRAGDCRAVSEF